MQMRPEHQNNEFYYMKLYEYNHEYNHMNIII
jgi:hypothetical protein